MKIKTTYRLTERFIFINSLNGENNMKDGNAEKIKRICKNKLVFILFKNTI